MDSVRRPSRTRSVMRDGGRCLRLATALVCRLVAAISTVPPLLASQELSTASGHYHLDVWHEQDSLRLAFTSNLVETRDGYLWLSSQSGLTRFDGVRFTVFNGTTLPLLRGHPDLQIYPLLEDGEGRLWIGTDGGMLAYDGTQLRATALDSSFSTDQVNVAAVDGAGTVWAVTRSGRVFRVARGGSPEIRRAVSTSYSGSGITVDAVGDIWIVVGASQVYRVHHDSLSAVAFPGEAGLADVRRVYATADSSIWLGMPNAIVQWRHGHFRRIPLPAGQALDAVSCFAMSPDGALWIGTRGAGLYRYDGRNFTSFTHCDGLSDDRVADILVDRTGNIWVATRDGLNRLRPVPFGVVTASAGLPAAMPGGMVQDASGVVWLAPPTGGLFKGRVTSGRAAFTSVEPVNHADRINALAVGQGGTIWAGRLGGTVTRFGGARSTERLAGLPPVTALLEDADGTLWVGTWNGLVRVADGRRTVLTTQNGLADNAVQRLFRDAHGTLWVATQKGLARAVNDSDRFVTQPMPPGSAERALVLFESPPGSVWVGTADGIARVTGGPPVFLTASRGLPESWVGAAELDGLGNLWLGQLRGLTRVSVADLEAVAEGRKPALTTAASFEALDGMPGGDPAGWPHPWSFKDAAGKLWFAMGHGLVTVDPTQQVERDVQPPLMHIEEVYLDGTRTPLAPTVTLAPGIRRVEIRYTGVDLANGPGVRFGYRLDGFDTGWTNAGAQRAAAYTRLAPGHYRFRVIGRAAGGAWSPSEATVSLVVEAPFYRRAWFVVLMTSLAALTLWSVYYVLLATRTAAIRDERSRLAREIHDSLLQGFGAIALQLHVTSARLGLSSSQQPLLDRVLSLIDRTLSHAREVVWDMRLPGVATTDLATECDDAARRIVADTRMSAHVTTHGRPRHLSRAVQTESLRIVEESLTNARKHSAASNVRVELNYGWRRLRVTIADNGCGFELDGDGTGAGHWGLLGMRERASRIGARLSVESAPGSGTRVALDVPYR